VNCSQDKPSDALRRMDLINRSARRGRLSARSSRHRKGRADAGESEAFGSAWRNPTHRPILDLGVGAGRSVPLLQGTSYDYVRLESMRELVRARPQLDARIIEGDARDRFQFADGAFQLVVRK
jgi:hypothetical protein